MHKTVQNLINIQNSIKSKIIELEYKDKIPKIIAVSKTFKINHISPLIDYGHIDYGENKVQEAVEKWSDIKNKNKNIKLHLIGKLQTNKVKFAVKLFDFIHSLDSEKLAKKIAEEQIKQEVRPKIFIQLNIGNETQKSGVLKENLFEFYKFSKKIGLDIVGLMCIPPFDQNTSKYFSEMLDLNQKIKLKELSMGMSSDFLNAIKYRSTYLRIGTNIFGKRV
tara:strand:+ start:342 stop:1004 length:663 start_codon:yes stop_codon:yes gene_type:complete